MPGWLDYFEVKINCPFCNSKIKVTIWEEGDFYPVPIVISGLMDGAAKCSVCNKLITDEN